MAQNNMSIIFTIPVIKKRLINYLEVTISIEGNLEVHLMEL